MFYENTSIHRIIHNFSKHRIDLNYCIVNIEWFRCILNIPNVYRCESGRYRTLHLFLTFFYHKIAVCGLTLAASHPLLERLVHLCWSSGEWIWRTWSRHWSVHTFLAAGVACKCWLSPVEVKGHNSELVHLHPVKQNCSIN